MIKRGYAGFDVLQAEDSKTLDLLGVMFLAAGLALVTALLFLGRDFMDLSFLWAAGETVTKT